MNAQGWLYGRFALAADGCKLPKVVSLGVVPVRPGTIDDLYLFPTPSR